MTNEFLYNFIKQHKYAVLSTVSKDNAPESAVVGIVVTKDLKLFFDTLSDSRKYQNLLSNPRISFVIGWDNEQSLQFEGIAKIPNTTELETLQKIYFETFPDGIDRKENVKNIAYICVEPTWVRYSDFNITPPKIEERTF